MIKNTHVPQKHKQKRNKIPVGYCHGEILKVMEK